jgi:predicted metal-dependent hydrolase
MPDLFPVDSIDEPRTIRLGERSVAYLLRRSARRHRIVITVDEHGLAVHASWRASLSGIERFLRDSTKWVLRKLDEWSRFEPRAQRWTVGESVSYVGRQLRLEIAQCAATASAVLRDDDRLLACLPTPDDETAVKHAVVSWYRRQARSNFETGIAHYAQRLAVAAPRLFLSSARTRWGSCNSLREIRLNWRLIQAPQPVIDYVVIHELAHLKEMNHSRRFWRLVAQVCPDHEDARSHLDERGRWYLAL